MECSYCGHENPEGDLYCSNCGMKLILNREIESSRGTEEEIRCRNCGITNPESASVCTNCGQPLVREQEPAKAAPPGACPACGFDKNPPSAQFCMNCGAEVTPGAPPTIPQQPVAKLVLPSMREIVISEGERTIGRSDFLDDVPPEDARFISREHFKITFENGKYYILDEKSANGTKLNGLEIRKQGKKELNNDDEIFLAETLLLKFRIG